MCTLGNRQRSCAMEHVSDLAHLQARDLLQRREFVLLPDASSACGMRLRL
jgi:hypothetical protein